MIQDTIELKGFTFKGERIGGGSPGYWRVSRQTGHKVIKLMLGPEESFPQSGWEKILDQHKSTMASNLILHDKGLPLKVVCSYLIEEDGSKRRI